MPGVSTRWVMERWETESGTCLRISQRRPNSGVLIRPVSPLGVSAVSEGLGFPDALTTGQ
ncbi:hypothetical protein EYF80_064805 [Liparis tanakae]|uniref:Uncharacterized protein n=1 Tax=Liparis tanakae TaxID=230148 RepID=A0A4Z2E8D6_9TELE|nr:hypothetical protein EYF80_064805 [Liparis tanakae]